MHRPRVTQVRFFPAIVCVIQITKKSYRLSITEYKIVLKKTKFGKFHQKCGTVGQIAKMWDKCGTKLQNVGNVGRLYSLYIIVHVFSALIFDA